MQEKVLLKRFRDEAIGFFDQVARSSERLYLVLLCMYLCNCFILKVEWIGEFVLYIGDFRRVVYSLIFWGGAIHLFFILVEWKKLLDRTIPLLILGLTLAILTIWLWRIFSEDRSRVVLDCYFCLMACGKNYRRILSCFLCIAAATLVIAALGRVVGFSLESVKPNNLRPGHSFGTIYPNTWGTIAFEILMLVWYLYLRRRMLWTFLLFWGACAFMYFVVSCRTIALLTAIFPVAALLPRWLDGRAAGKPASVCAALIPAFFFMLTMFLCWRMEWVHRVFYGTPLNTMAMRFVQGGIGIKLNSIPLIGHPFRNWNQSVILNGVPEYLNVVDNSFVAYIILRGAIWMAICIGWMGFAHYRIAKNGDLSLMLLSTMICLYAVMECPGLDLWYNFVLLYPLARISAVGGNVKEGGDERI